MNGWVEQNHVLTHLLLALLLPVMLQNMFQQERFESTAQLMSRYDQCSLNTSRRRHLPCSYLIYGNFTVMFPIIFTNTGNQWSHFKLFGGGGAKTARCQG